MRLDCDRVAGQTEECTTAGVGREEEDCLYSLRNIGAEGKVKGVKLSQSGNRSPVRSGLLSVIVFCNLGRKWNIQISIRREFCFNQDQFIHHRNPLQ